MNKRNTKNKSGFTILEVFVVFAIIAILTTLLIPAFRSACTDGTFQCNNCLCVKTFEQTNGRHSSDLIAVFELPNQIMVSVKCPLELYTKIQESKHYDIEYSKFSYDVGIDGMLTNVIKVFTQAESTQ